ncbi:MAG: hydroxymethylbilane synthase [Microthrixaceae bacterium]|nr:hydroxymethylbilane synthase [Microthrixaceae bacterium]HPB44393.1 hydroxymethylbilane synthase [Microthrixaceae bacterium]
MRLPHTITLRIATRASALALWQANHVAELLAVQAEARGLLPEVELVTVSTEGDRRLDVALSAIGGKGVFVKEVQAAVLDGRADLAVHSAKDLPALTPDGLVIAALPERADPRDALVGVRLDDLAAGATVATGSARRRAQLAALRPDLGFVELRGNIDTRLAKVGEVDAIVVAAAALDRLGRTPEVVDRLGVDTMIPQVGQAALAVETRADDTDLTALVAQLDHADTRRCVTAERSFLETLGGDCELPAGAYATLVDGAVRLRAMLLAVETGEVCRTELVGEDPVEMGTNAAHELSQRVELR